MIIGIGLMVAIACGTPEPGTTSPTDSTSVNSTDTTAKKDSIPNQ